MLIFALLPLHARGRGGGRRARVGPADREKSASARERRGSTARPQATQTLPSHAVSTRGVDQPSPTLAPCPDATHPPSQPHRARQPTRPLAHATTHPPKAPLRPLFLLVLPAPSSRGGTWGPGKVFESRFRTAGGLPWVLDRFRCSKSLGFAKRARQSTARNSAGHVAARSIAPRAPENKLTKPCGGEKNTRTARNRAELREFLEQGENQN